MSRIQLLPDILASQVAAGEVVERPASVVKELVENSIDAGARKIETVIRRGGISLVRVVDDGCGMDRDDALLSLERHATSKIRTAADLAAIGTLGFRGEALPSIASVSRFRLTTRETDAVAGTEIIISGGRIDTVRDGGDAPGTQVEARSLFYNLPADGNSCVRRTPRVATSNINFICKQPDIRRSRSFLSGMSVWFFNCRRPCRCAIGFAISTGANWSSVCLKCGRAVGVSQSRSPD